MAQSAGTCRWQPHASIASQTLAGGTLLLVLVLRRAFDFVAVVLQQHYFVFPPCRDCPGPAVTLERVERLDSGDRNHPCFA